MDTDIILRVYETGPSGEDTETHVVRVAHEKPMSPAEIEAAMRAAVADYLATDAGKWDVEHTVASNPPSFNWGDAVNCLPVEYWQARGIRSVEWVTDGRLVLNHDENLLLVVGDRADAEALGLALLEASGDIREKPVDDGREFYVTQVVVTILSERPITEDSLDDIAYQISDGDYSGRVNVLPSRRVDGATMARLLMEQARDPSFFGLNEDGSPLAEGDGEDDDESLDID